MNPAARALESLDRYQALERVPDYSARLDGGLKYMAYPHGEEIHYAPEPRLCHMVVTFRSLLWMFLGLLGSFVVIVSLAAPHWLVGKHRWIGITSHHTNGSLYELGVERTYRPTIGIFGQCNQIYLLDYDSRDLCTVAMETSLQGQPTYLTAPWKLAVSCFIIGLLILIFSVLTSSLALCIRYLCRRNIYSFTGSIQTIAGLLLVAGLILFPAGWSNPTVHALCGKHAQAFLLDHCTLGWAFYTMLLGALLVFISAVFSMKAEEATSSDKVESKMLDGNHVICIM